MLSELVVENLGVIDRAEITLGPGSSALTGETGAGKTLLVAAVELLAGGRADRAQVRQGATEARIDGRFEVPEGHPVAALLAAAGIGGDEGVPLEVIVSRSVSADGRSKARINGRPVTLGLLSEVGAGLVEIAGQHEHLRLADRSVQRNILDSFAGDPTVARAAEVADAVGELASARARLEELEAGARQRARDMDVLAFEVKEIEDAGIREGEIDDLTVRIGRLEHAEGLARGLGTARRALKGEERALDSLAAAGAELDALVVADPGIADLAHRLSAAAIEITDVAEEMARFEVAPDAAALEEGRARLHALARLRKKYGDGETEILEHLDKARSALARLESEESDVESVRNHVVAAEEHARTLAASLSEMRRLAVPALTETVGRLLAELAMPGARFEVELAETDLYEGGAETIEFLMSANPGETPRSLSKVASGGELSRICLSLRLAGRDAGVTSMVFDEVDAGIGGRAARAVGEHLAELATDSGAQVLVVTHLPQVAAAADSHYVVAKLERAGRTAVRVEKVEGPARVEELSRMLAGMPDSELAREHAQELLEVATRANGR